MDIINTKKLQININQEYIYSTLRFIGNKLLKNPYKNKWTLENPTYGYCYIVTEAIYHFTDEDYIPQCLNLGNDIGVHWYLKDKNSKKIIDFTSTQFDFKIDYSKGIGKGFMKGSISTKKGFISKRGYEMAKLLKLN